MSRLVQTTAAIFGRPSFDPSSIQEMVGWTPLYLKGIVVYIFFVLLKRADGSFDLNKYAGSAAREESGGRRTLGDYERPLQYAQHGILISGLCNNLIAAAAQPRAKGSARSF